MINSEILAWFITVGDNKKFTYRFLKTLVILYSS